MSMSISLITNVCHDVYQNVSTNLYLLVVTIQISRTRTSIQRINKNTSTVTMSFNSLSFKMLIVALGVVAMKISNTMIDRFLKNKFYIYHLIADFKYIVKWNIKITNHCLNILKSKYKRNQIKSAIKHINKELKPRKSATGSCMVKKFQLGCDIYDWEESMESVGRVIKGVLKHNNKGITKIDGVYVQSNWLEHSWVRFAIKIIGRFVRKFKVPYKEMSRFEKILNKKLQTSDYHDMDKFKQTYNFTQYTPFINNMLQDLNEFKLNDTITKQHKLYKYLNVDDRDDEDENEIEMDIDLQFTEAENKEENECLVIDMDDEDSKDDDSKANSDNVNRQESECMENVQMDDNI
eukprot:532218_1